MTFSLSHIISRYRNLYYTPLHVILLYIITQCWNLLHTNVQNYTLSFFQLLFSSGLILQLKQDPSSTGLMRGWNWIVKDCQVVTSSTRLPAMPFTTSSWIPRPFVLRHFLHYRIVTQMTFMDLKDLLHWKFRTLTTSLLNRYPFITHHYTVKWCVLHFSRFYMSRCYLGSSLAMIGTFWAMSPWYSWRA